MLAGEERIATEAKAIRFLLSVVPCGPAREQPSLLQLPELWVSSKGKCAIVTEWGFGEPKRQEAEHGIFQRVGEAS